MCLTVYYNAEKQVAKRPLVRYKQVVAQADKHWVGPYFTKRKYKFDEVETAEWQCGWGGWVPISHLTIRCMFLGIFEIDEGFHTYIKKPVWVKLWYNGACLCIIPKGAEYCDGLSNQTASTHLIVCSSKRQFVKQYIKNYFSKPIKLK